MKNKEFNFEEALKRIEYILKQLENKDLDLDTAISLYEEGLKLINYCEQKLKDARTRVEVIIKEKEGFRLEKFEKELEFFKNDN